VAPNAVIAASGDHAETVAETIWMDSWQMQCCGQPFEIGSHVTWTIRAPDAEWVADVLGHAGAARVTAAEEHHEAAEDAPRMAR
jgi:hypothetical protein